MMKLLKGFKRGGVHPDGMKYLTRSQLITELALAEELVVPLSQHIGAPASIMVEKGDIVACGQLIAESSGFISAPVHSPADGEVSEIRKVVLPNGIKVDAVVIKTAVHQTKPEYKPVEWKNNSSAQLLKKVADAGVVGAGGATFPTHVKLSVPKGKKASFLVINGVECEPYLNADNRLMMERTDEIIEGIEVVNQIVQAEKILFGIENNKPAAIQLLREAITAKNLDVEIVPLRVRYPQGDEKQLLKAVIGKEVPSGALPIEIGAVVVNAGTVNAIYEAVVLEKPFYERVLTVSGKAIRNPGNYRVAVGTSFSDLIAACGGFQKPPRKLVSGGPMMGFAIYEPDKTPVTKGTSGILALTDAEVNSSVETACLNCGKCIKACPMGLHPTGMYRTIGLGEFEKTLKMGLLDCKECGCCSYICPAQLPLVHGFKMAKREARKLQRG